MIRADVRDHTSLHLMARQARIVLNCVGPFTTYGEPVIKACIDENTHYVDITGEPQFIEAMPDKYHEEAKAKNLFIINACGLDCISTDMGVVFLQQNFKGVLNSVELYIKIWEEGQSTSGSLINNGTWNSAVITAGSWDFKTLFQLLTKKRRNIVGSPKVSQK